MNICFSKSTKAEGSVLVVAMGIVAVAALVLGSYLTVVKGQSDSVYRSQCYGTAIPVAEAGLEEGLTLLNKYYPNITSSGSWTNNLTADGWGTMSSSNTTSKSNWVYGSNYYLVTVSNTPAGRPVVFSTGVVPYIQNSWGGLMTPNTSLSSSVIALARTLEIQTTVNGLFSAAIAAKGDVTFTGGAGVDSFNSVNTNLSANGQYTSLKVDDQAVVATDATVISAISASGSVNIRGYVNTGTNGSISESGSISIGDNNWVSNGTAGIELSRSNDTFNVAFPDVSAPSATFVMSPSSGVVSGTNYTLVFQGSQYWGSSNVMYETSVSLTGQHLACVTNGAVVLYIPQGDTLSFSGQSAIYISPGSSLAIYCGASSVSMSGGSFMGATNALDLAFYGLPTCTAVNFSGSASFIGTIYAPEADFTDSGGATFIGAMVANSFTFSGGATVHYDENLANAGPSTGYVATGWQELTGPLAFYQNIVP